QASGGIVLIDAEAGAACGTEVAVKIAIAAGAFYKIEHAIGNGLRDTVERSVDGDSSWALGRRTSSDVSVGANRERALVVVLVAVENHIDTMVFEEFGNGSHLVVFHGGVAGRKRRLVEDHELPGLRAGIEIVDEPVAKDGGIGRERQLRSAKNRGAVED